MSFRKAEIIRILFENNQIHSIRCLFVLSLFLLLHRSIQSMHQKEVRRSSLYYLMKKGSKLG